MRTLSSEPAPQPFGPDDADWEPDTEITPALATEPGVHRAVWDLAWEGAEFLPDVKVDAGNGRQGPQVLPGDYTLRLSADGVVLTQPLRVEADPRSQTANADRAAQLALALGIRDHLTTSPRWSKPSAPCAPSSTRAPRRSPVVPRPTELAERGVALTTRLTTIEEAIHNPEAEVGYDILAGRKGGAKLYSRLGWLYEAVKEHEGRRPRGWSRSKPSSRGCWRCKRRRSTSWWRPSCRRSTTGPESSASAT
ncbi:MAG: hypothetical protein HC897_06275 [Thermoanaerobaculia bacterium]|nr:hypothetical protein [Thermoanaerobaculia bacterium]